MSTPTSTRVDLHGRRAWVTGASRGLGRAIAVGLARAGADLVVTARTDASLATVATEVEALGRTVLRAPADVADGKAVRAVAAEIRGAWGGLDVLVNSAGISPVFTRAENIEDDTWRAVLDVNVTGTFNCARAAAQLMDAGGSVINLSSIHGQAGAARMAAYAASKGAVDALSRSLALEWSSRRVRVNTVAPGYVETDMTEGLRQHPRWRDYLLDKIPMGRFAVAEEIVDAVLFLASGSSAYMTGSTLVIDGGWTAA